MCLLVEDVRTSVMESKTDLEIYQPGKEETSCSDTPDKHILKT